MAAPIAPAIIWLMNSAPMVATQDSPSAWTDSVKATFAPAMPVPEIFSEAGGS
jgi:hypothetical protein